MQYQQAFQRIGDSQLFPNMENSSVLVQKMDDFMQFYNGIRGSAWRNGHTNK